MSRRGAVVLGSLAAVVLAVLATVRMREPAPAPLPASVTETQVRRLLFRELQPVRLANCEFGRFGEPNDGGYLLCRNLLARVEAAYSYGISGYDGWGCDVSRTFGVPVHQYDCFNLTVPVCHEGNTMFHAECVGTGREVKEDRLFDTLARQVERNGDSGKRLVVKIDVEGAEWESLLQAPDALLRSIDQLAIEFHGFDKAHYVEAVRRLKQFFYVAHLHWNNYSCVKGQPPFQAWAYEVLFVSRRIGVLDPSGTPTLPHPLDAPNDPNAADCQIPGE